MHIYIGDQFFGKVDAVGEEAVHTKVFVAGVPLFAKGSYYGRRINATEVIGTEIGLHRLSALLSFVRFYGWMVPVFVLVMASSLQSPSLLFGGVVATLLMVWTFFVGRPTPEQRRQRLLLEAFTGTTIPPSYLPSDVAQQTADELRERCFAAVDPHQVIADKQASMDALRAGYVWAMYAAAGGDAQAATLAEVAWKRICGEPDSKLHAPARQSPAGSPPSGPQKESAVEVRVPVVIEQKRDWLTLSPDVPLPGMCCSCLKSTATQVVIPISLVRGHAAEPISAPSSALSIPQCNTCREADKSRMLRRMLFWGGLGLLLGGAGMLGISAGDPKFGSTPLKYQLMGCLFPGAVLGVCMAWIARAMTARPAQVRWRLDVGCFEIKPRNSQYAAALCKPGLVPATSRPSKARAH